ncbi:MAG TPA: hypothetical protein V6D10_03245 [Trichocoleus sp.]|jgi:predicted XRE-type DNA-binding protein
MVRFDHRILAVGALTALVLFGCGQPETSTPSVSNAPASESTTTSTTTTTTTESTDMKGFDGLTNVVTQAKTDVAAGNYAKAKDEFNRFEDYWSQVEDGVKAKSSDTYDAIEETMDKVNDGLKQSQPNQAQLLSTLTELQSKVTSAAKL